MPTVHLAVPLLYIHTLYALGQQKKQDFGLLVLETSFQRQRVAIATRPQQHLHLRCRVLAGATCLLITRHKSAAGQAPPPGGWPDPDGCGWMDRWRKQSRLGPCKRRCCRGQAAWKCGEGGASLILTGSLRTGEQEGRPTPGGRWNGPLPWFARWSRSAMGIQVCGAFSLNMRCDAVVLDGILRRKTADQWFSNTLN